VNADPTGAGIRTAVVDDIPGIRHVARITWHHTYRDSIPERVRAEFLDRAYSAASLAERIGSNVFLVALDDGTVVGFADFRPLPESRVELAALYVLPEAQGRGIGTHLLRTGIDRFLRGTEFVLRVERENTAARRFYEARGFQPRGESAEVYLGHEFRDVEMVLEPGS
jgi:ribosomal protein S18 acetylase RimI-like enzyme